MRVGHRFTQDGVEYVVTRMTLTDRRMQIDCMTVSEVRERIEYLENLLGELGGKTNDRIRT